MCARFQSSHVQTPADRQSRAHPPRPIHARDGSMPQAQLLRRSLSPNRRGRRLVSRAWTARPLDAGVPPAPRRLGYLPCPLRLKPSTEQSVQHSHSIPALARRVYSLLSVSSESQETPPPLPSLARELLSGELSRHRPPPPETAPGAPSRRHKATRVFFPANPTLHRPPHLPPDAPSTTPRPSPSHSVSSSANTVDRPWSASCQRLRR